MSIFFDGNSTSIDLGTPDVPSGTTAMTMCAFFTHVQSGDARILSKANGTTVNNHFWKIGVNTQDKFQMRVGTTTNNSVNLAGNTNIIESRQYFGAGVYTGTEMQLWLADFRTDDRQIFLDGQASQSGVVQTNSGVSATIGDNPVGDRFFLGSITDVRVYNRALSSKELQNIVIETGQDSILDGLIYRWGLNEGTDGEVATGVGAIKDLGELKFDGTPKGNLIYRDALPFAEKPLFL